MPSLVQRWHGHIFPSKAYEEGGIHEAIADYEDAVFFDILAEELARRDLGLEDHEPEDYTELTARMDEYLDEFDRSGLTRRSSAPAPSAISARILNTRPPSRPRTRTAAASAIWRV